MTTPRVFTPAQRTAAAFAAGAVRVAALVCRRNALELEATELWRCHDMLIDVSGVTFARDAEAAAASEGANS